MARAGSLEKVTTHETYLSRKYLAKELCSHIKGELSHALNSAWLVNETSKATYNVTLLEPADPMTSMNVVRFDTTNGNPDFGVAGADWMALHEPFRNKAYLIKTSDLLQWATAAMRGDLQCEFFGCRIDGGKLHVAMHLDWAAGSGLVKLVADLGKGKFLKWREKQLITKEDYVHLHCHSTYSLLDGASRIEGVSEQAFLNGQPGIALTDHGYMFGAYKHWMAGKKLGIKPLMGVEAYVVDDVGEKYKAPDGHPRRFEYHQTLIAMNQVGWSNLCKLMTTACRDNHYYAPRIDHRELFTHHEGIIVLSGCFKGMAAHYLQTRQLREGETELNWWLRRDVDRARNYIKAYKQRFGDRYYGEVMNIDYEPYMAIVPELCQLLDDEGVPKVLTCDCHYEREEDAILQAVLTKISNQRVDGLGEQMKEKGCYYIRPLAEMEAGAGSWYSRDMASRTCEILERCDLTFNKDGYMFPVYDKTQDRDWATYQQFLGASKC